ncbi:MAG TPA: hypothetical protein ENJ46_04550, partial [Hellea balneolensis]|nr:hypothetical protein [Hellea balneolensis]
MNRKIHHKTPSAPRVFKHGARYVAARALQDVFDKQFALDVALSEQDLFTQLEPRDRAFARLISATVLRRMGQIDNVLATFVKKPPPDYPYFVLRCAVAQMLFLQTAPHAAVDGAVALLKRSKKTFRMSGMANAVLRRVAEQGPELLEKTTPLDNIPDWLRTSWSEAYGEDAALAIATAATREPPLDITLKTASDSDIWQEKLDATLMPTGTLRRSKIGQIVELPGYDEGAWWVQDISAALPVKLFGDMVGKRALDMCAAPGGKTLQLAAGGADVTALDKSGTRLERVRENLKRTGLDATLIRANAAIWTPNVKDKNDPEDPGLFDCVLLDAPCSATGTFRRRPDVLHLKSPAHVESLERVQSKLLLNAAQSVKKGGTLVYCTCSLQAEEGEAHIEAFLQKMSDFRLNSILSTEVGDLAEIVSEK